MCKNRLTSIVSFQKHVFAVFKFSGLHFYCFYLYIHIYIFIFYDIKIQREIIQEVTPDYIVFPGGQCQCHICLSYFKCIA